MKTNLNKIFIFISCLLFSSSSFSYPHFVGLGYTSCITCHYNPFGNGPLNDYGRALGATGVAARWLTDEKTTEEELATRSGFFFNKPKNNWFRPSLDYRGLYYRTNYGTDEELGDYINMMLDLNLVVKANEANNLFFSGTFGYAPTPASFENSNIEFKNYRSREAYLGYRPTNSLGLYLGLMDKIYGIRIAEHSNYSRSVSGMNQNDQSLGAQVHFSQPSFEVGLNYFTGNPAQENDKLRQKGASLKADYVLSHKASIGASYLNSKSSFLKQYMAAFHVKSAVGKGSAVMVEIGKISKKSILETITEEYTYGFGQTYLNLTRGVFLINSLDYLRNIDGNLKMRFGPGIQVFPSQRLEFRFEVYNTRNLSKKVSIEDTWDFLGQTHLWF